jgi:hypothetical protein
VKALARDMRGSAQLREVGLTFEMLVPVRPERAIATVVRLPTRATRRCWITAEAVTPRWPLHPDTSSLVADADAARFDDRACSDSGRG